MMMLADWIDALSELPQEAVKRAIRERVKSGDRARPLPGEIRERAKAFIAQAEREPEPAPFAPPPPLTAEQLARRREIAAEYGMRVLDDGSVEPNLKRAGGANS